MRRMYSENQVIEMIREYAPEVTPEDIQAMFDEGEVSLTGKYVRIMDAPSSNILTDEQIAQIQEGCFINGTFLTYKNPILFPFGNTPGSTWQSLGSFLAVKDAEWYLGTYELNRETKGIRVYGIGFTFYRGELTIHNLKTVNTFNYPVAASQNNVTSGDTITLNSALDKALKGHMEVEINGHRCRFESEETSGESIYIIYSSFGEVSATGKLTANIISYNKSNREISFNQMTFTPDA